MTAPSSGYTDLLYQNMLANPRPSTAGIPGLSVNELQPIYSSGGQESGGIGSSIIDALSRTLYASANTAKTLVKQSQHDEDAEDNIFQSFWEGLSAEKTPTYYDVMDEINPDMPEAFKFIGGLAGDILLDPANLVAMGATSGVKAAFAATKAGKRYAETSTAAGRAAKRAADDAANAALPNVPPSQVPTVGLNRRADLQFNGWYARAMDPLRRRFRAGYGFEDMYDVMRNGNSVPETSTMRFRKSLRDITKRHGEQTFNDAYSGLRRSQTAVDPTVRAAQTELLAHTDRLFNPNDPVLQGFFRDTRKVEALNKYMGEKGVSHRFDPAAANYDMRRTMEQWKQWNVDDPADFLDRMNAAISRMTGLEGMAKDIEKFSHTTARPGYVRLNRQQGTLLGPHLNPNRYYHKDIAEQITRMEDWLQQPVNFHGQTGTLANIVNNVIEPVMNVWKPYMTIARPGHHVRNVYSDMILTAMDGLWNMGMYKKALTALRTGGAITRTDGVSSLREFETGALRSGGDHMSTVRLRGSNQNLSYDAGFQLAYRNGLLPSHRVTEDFFDTGEKSNKLTKALLENPYMRLAGVVSEQSGHFTRMAHYIGLLEQKKFTRQFSTIEEAAAAAAARVKKWHPDPTGLTPYERKNLRALIPFYSWQRQILPTQVNLAIFKPGKVTGIPKIGVEFQKAMGLEPESLSDPFPDDTAYPSFVMQNLIGPLWKGEGGSQWSLATGTPTEAIFGDLLNGNPGRNVLGAVNPMIQAVAESATGINAESGRTIWDTRSHMESQLPVINWAAKITGYSPLSIAQHLLQGNIGIDKTRENEKGQFNVGVNIANLLTGIGMSDIRNTTYRNLAKQELTQ